MAALPLAHLNQLNLFKGFKWLCMKASLMQVSHGFALPTDNAFILLVLMSHFGAAFCTVEQGFLQLPECSSFTRKTYWTEQFLFSFNNPENGPRLTSLRFDSLDFLFFRVFYIVTVGATVIAGRFVRTFKGLRT